MADIGVFRLAHQSKHLLGVQRKASGALILRRGVGLPSKCIATPIKTANVLGLIARNSATTNRTTQGGIVRWMEGGMTNEIQNSPTNISPIDRFDVIERRLKAIREQVRALDEERRRLEDEQVMLWASADGFRIGASIEWNGNRGVERGVIACVWAGSGSRWTLGIRQDGTSDLARVGPSKKPRRVYQDAHPVPDQEDFNGDAPC